MTILPATAKIPESLRSTIDALEASIDRSVLIPPVIRTAEEAEDVATRLVSETEARNSILAKIDKYAKLADTIHKFITGKRREFVSFYDARIRVLGAAAAVWTTEVERRRQEEEAKLREQARKDEEERQRQEAAELKRRAAAEQRPDLAQRAKEIETAPVREMAVHVSSGIRKTASGAAAIGKGVTVGRDFEVQILDDDALIHAISRPFVYREIANQIRAQFKDKGEKFATWLEAQAASHPQIPTSVVKVQDTKVKAFAKGCDGKMNWPGVAVSATAKTTTRTR